MGEVDDDILLQPWKVNFQGPVMQAKGWKT